jgi:nucleotide-binding universal stress UspA family protein
MTEHPQDRIVVGVDGSPEAREALRWASRLAGLRSAEIVAVHALGLLEEIDGHLAPAHARRAEVERLMTGEWCGGVRGQGRAVRAVVREGAAVDVLVAVAREEQAELLVVGSRGIGEAPALALGSTSLRLLQISPLPVLVVPTPDQAGRHLALRRIMAAVDGSSATRPAIDAAADFAALLGAELEVVHAVDEAPVFPLGPASRATSEGEWDAAMRAWRALEPLCEQARARHVPVHVSIARGEPDEAVRRRAADIDADLIVVATRHWGDQDQPLLDSVSRRTATFGHRPTLVVPVLSVAEQPARQIA